MPAAMATSQGHGCRAAIRNAAQEEPVVFSIFSEDNAVVEKVIAQSTSGGICVNETLNHATSFDPSLATPL